MNQGHLNNIFNTVLQGFQQAIPLMPPTLTADEYRLELLNTMLFQLHVDVQAGMVPFGLATDEYHVALVICALGPIGGVPPSMELFTEISDYVNADPSDQHIHRSENLLLQIQAQVGNQPLPREAAHFQSTGGSDTDPVVHAAVWFGLGANGREMGTGWLDLWPVAERWLRKFVERARLVVDRAIIRWNRPNLNGFAGPNGIAPTVAKKIADRMVRFVPPEWVVGREKGIKFSFRPMPSSDRPIADLLNRPDYHNDWNEAGMRVFIGDMEIARRAETRFVFWSMSRLKALDGRQVILADKRTVASSRDRQVEVDGNPGWKTLPMCQKSPQEKVYVPRQDSLIRESYCHCGSENCDEQHHIRGWDPLAEPYIGLENFLYNAVKGSMVRRGQGDVLRWAGNSMKAGAYYPYLANGNQVLTQLPIRFVETLVWRCPGCGKKDYSPIGFVHLLACPGPPPVRKSDGRVVPFSINDWVLRRFVKSGNPVQIQPFSSVHVLNHPWFRRFEDIAAGAGATCPGWWGGLNQEDILVKLHPAHFLPILGNVAGAQAAMDVLRRVADLRPAYQQLLECASAAPGWPPAGEADRWNYIVEDFCHQRKWFYLLIHGLPGHLAGGPPLSDYDQFCLIQAEGKRAGWRGSGPAAKVTHLWCKE